MTGSRCSKGMQSNGKPSLSARSLFTSLVNERDNRMSVETQHIIEAIDYSNSLKRHKNEHHSQCIFERNPPVETLELKFNDNGTLAGGFVCNEEHQGYDHMVHGGLIAAIVDASMTQCCIGHDVVAFTGDLNIRYKRPVYINKHAQIETSIKKSRANALHFLECNIQQDGELSVKATGKFYSLSKRNEEGL
jgi:acyl-coenzyme A thioesterase PaaI-like protein